MTKFAADTSVSSDKSRAEIERILRRYGADRFAYMAARDHAVIGFEFNTWRIRFDLPMPDPKEGRFTHTPGRKSPRAPSQAHEAWEQACRQKWRALALVIKAKLEAVESGITVFEKEFLAHIVLPDGQTVGDTALPALIEARDTGRKPALLGKF